MRELSYEDLAAASFLRSFEYDGYVVGFAEFKGELVCIARPREGETIDDRIVYKVCQSVNDPEEQAEVMNTTTKSVTDLIDKRVCEYLERLLTINAR